MKAIKLPSGHYRIAVQINKKRYARTFNTELEALQWGKMMKSTKGKGSSDEIKELSFKEIGFYKKHKVSIDYEIEIIDKMSGKQFEEYCAYLITYSGLLPYSDIKQTKTSGDFGADLIITTIYGERICVQCKRIAEKGHVGTDAIQEVVASKKHYSAKHSMIITTTRFTENAIALAYSNNVLLIDRKKLINLVKLKNQNIKAIEEKRQWKEFLAAAEKL